MSILVTQKAPDFTAAAVHGNGEIVSDFNLYQTIENKNAILFFYPLDFTFVCPSELIALENRYNEFIQRDTVLIGVSIDSEFTHHAWRNTPIENGGIGQVRFPLVGDIKHDICRAYGIEHPEKGVAFRATFLIDKKGFVRSQMVNDLPIGRNIDEVLRLIDALDFHEQYGEVCPANWSKGKSGIKATKEGISSFLEVNAEAL